MLSMSSSHNSYYELTDLSNKKCYKILEISYTIHTLRGTVGSSFSLSTELLDQKASNKEI